MSRRRGWIPRPGAACGESSWSLKEEGRTIFLSTDYMEEAEQLCDRVAIMDRGGDHRPGHAGGVDPVDWRRTAWWSLRRSRRPRAALHRLPGVKEVRRIRGDGRRAVVLFDGSPGGDAERFDRPGPACGAGGGPEGSPHPDGDPGGRRPRLDSGRERG